MIDKPSDKPSNKRPWVFIQGQQAFQFDGQQHDSLLEAMEAHKVPVHFECRSGYCGACRTTTLEGEVDYQHQPIAFIRKGEILPCCCQPTTDITLVQE